MGADEEAWLSRDREDSTVTIRSRIEAEEAANLKLELYEYRGLREEQNRLVMDKQKDDLARGIFFWQNRRVPLWTNKWRTLVVDFF